MTARKPTAALEDTPVFHPMLLAVCPILGLYAYNVGNVPWNALFRPIAVALVATGILLTGFRIALRDKHRAGLVTSLLVLASTWGWSVAESSIRGASRLIQSLTPPLVYGVLGLLIVMLALGIVAANRANKRRALMLAGLFLAIVLAGALAVVLLFDRIFGTVASTMLLAYTGLAVAGLVFLARWRRDFRPFTRTANWFGVILIVLYVALVFFNAPISDRMSPPPLEPAVAAARSADELPDIYLLLLEGYARCDVLLRVYGYNDLPVLESLQDRNMRVEVDAFSNYAWGMQSAMALLNMDYFESLAPADAPDDLEVGRFINLYHQNRFFQTLHSAGYEILAYSPGVQVLEPGPLVDRCLTPPRTPSEFEVVLLQSTACRRFMELITYAQGRDPRAWQLGFRRARVNHVFDTIGDVASEEHTRPRLVFAHLTMPDSPFMFGRKGEWADHRIPSAPQESYLSQLHHTSSMLLHAVEQVTSRSTRPAAIVLASAHGPRLHNAGEPTQPESLAEQFGILLCTHYPKGDPESQTPPATGVSLVNTLRHTLNRALGANLPILEDKAVLTPPDFPLQGQPVTVPTLENVVLPVLEDR